MSEHSTEGLLVCIDVDDLEHGVRFYTQALGLQAGRRFESGWIELVGRSAPIYLLEKKGGSAPAPGSAPRTYARHWTPVHLDFVVDDIAQAAERAEQAGARIEKPAFDEPYGKLALLSDPFGNGFCLIEFNEAGYDAIAV